MQTFRTVNINAINEMALRFGWRKPATKPVQPLSTLPWGRVLGRRTTILRGGVEMETVRFYALFQYCKNPAERGAAFGGVLEEYEERAKALGLEGVYHIRTQWSWDFPRFLQIRFGFDPVTGVWGLSGKEIHAPTTKELSYGITTESYIFGVGKITEILKRKGITRFSSNNPEKAAEIFQTIDKTLREMEG